MPDKMTIHVNVDSANQTLSKFAVTEGGRVTFVNDAAAGAQVTFAGTSPLCLGTTPQLSVTIAAGATKSLKVCANAGGQEFKYTATVTGATPEDPILIIERAALTPPDLDPVAKPDPIVYPDGYIYLALAAIAGIFIGYYAAKRRFLPRK